MGISKCLVATRVRCIVALIFLIVVTPPVVSQQKKPAKKLNVAVLDFVARAPVTPDEAATFSDVFTSQLIQSGEFEVLERNQIQALLKEQNFQQSGLCDQVECMVETGKLLKVQRMFAGTVGRLGTLYNINIRVVNVETGKIELDRTRQYEGRIETLASDVIPEFADQIAEAVTGRTVSAQGLRKSSSGWYWYVGGAVILGGGAAAYYFLRPTEKKTATNTYLPGPPTPPQ
jgi:TolB-like protein